MARQDVLDLSCVLNAPVQSLVSGLESRVADAPEVCSEGKSGKGMSRAWRRLLSALIQSNGAPLRCLQVAGPSWHECGKSRHVKYHMVHARQLSNGL